MSGVPPQADRDDWLRFRRIRGCLPSLQTFRDDSGAETVSVLPYAELAAECARLNEHCRDLSRQHHEALDEIERLRAGVLDIADRRPMSATTRRRLRELVGAPPQTPPHAASQDTK